MDVDEAYDDWNTSVHQAARLGNVVLLRELLQQRYPTNGRNNMGWRPLHVAVAGGHLECVRLLLMADDAEVDALACGSIRWMYNADNTLTRESLTALHLACGPGECQTEIVKLLLRAGADPNMKCGDGFSLPLSKAVSNNLYDIVKLLLDAGGDPNKMDSLNGTPLRAALKKGHLKIAQLLLERGSNVDFQPINFLFVPPRHIVENSMHPIMEDTRPACFILDEATLIPIIDLLVNWGLDVNAQIRDGSTPLMLAVQWNKVGVVSRLLELGANPCIEDISGFLALHYTIRYWPDTSTEWHYGSEEGNTELVFRRILDVTLRELVIPANLQKIPNSIFHVAIGWEKFNTLKLLVNAGLPLHAFLQETESYALDEADQELTETDFSLFGQIPKVIDLGIEVDTPLANLLCNKPLNKKSVEIAKLMIEKGSNVNAVVPRSLPPLVAAVKHQQDPYSHGHPSLDILEHLLNNGVDVIRATDILPAALHVSSLINVQAFFALLVRCIPVHEIYTPRTLASLSQLYIKYYNEYPLFPWRVISWLNVVNAFVPQLPLDTKNMFDIRRLIEDDNLSRAWDDLDAQIGSPKKLEQLCILTVRRVVGERRGWNHLTTFLRKMTLMNEPLPDLIIDLLMFKQMASVCLLILPPICDQPRYALSAANP